MIHVTKILYPTDFSSYSNQAYFHAVSLAEKHHASLTIVYVYPSRPSERTHDRAYWQAQLEQIHPVDAAIPVSHVLLDGDPATEIIKYATDAGIDLIVLGTHGRTGKEKLLMGSVAEKVMQDATCSVLVVKLPKGASTSGKSEVQVAFA